MPKLTVTGVGRQLQFPVDFLWIKPQTAAQLFPFGDPDLKNWPYSFVLTVAVIVWPGNKPATNLDGSNFKATLLVNGGWKPCTITKVFSSAGGFLVYGVCLPPTALEFFEAPQFVLLKANIRKLRGEAIITVMV